ncbi:hypothetical protein SCLARK_00660 [Spiroplasma clarkii]|uniref:DUF4064 domain-containing protein n=1 Tax=Spiroplasma clarkii TaxID=2139 RepID=A0A1Y0L023_9MOLU|nr:hypothetical protein [Spiroplasma clarkii]ARU91323.1 hypothetical protein SCLARK_00660 [Spiroplasma clarkii]ATX70747.1 hypothetical protein SCLAR_v1c04230 [Spiroplasma clarkii]
MKSVAKTINNVGSYIFLTSLIPIMTFAIILIGIKHLIESGLETFSDFGEWLKSILSPSLETISQLGVIILTVSLVLFVVVLIQTIFNNMKKEILVVLGSLISFLVGFALFWIGAIPFFKTVNDPSSISLVTGLLFIYLGISGTLMVSGSALYLLAFFLFKKRTKASKKTD